MKIEEDKLLKNNKLAEGIKITDEISERIIKGIYKNGNETQNPTQPDTLNESELIRLIQWGNEQYFNELWLRYCKGIFHFIFRMCGNEDKAEDITQKTAIKVWRNINQFRGEGSFKSWVYRIAIREWINEHRRPNRENQLDSDQIISNNIEIKLTRQEEHDIVHKALNQLSQKEREVIELRDIEGYSVEETAARLNIRQGTVQSRKFRGLIQLKKEILRLIKNYPTLQSYIGLKEAKNKEQL